MKALFLSLLAIALLSGCSSSAEDEITYGYFESGVYYNDYFGLALPVTEGWSVQGEAALRDQEELGKRLIAGDNKNLEATLRAAEKQNITFLSVFKYEVGSPVDFNPNITAGAENMSGFPGVKTGADYLYHARQLLEQAQMDYTFAEDIYSTTVSGVDFHVLPAQVDFQVAQLHQDYYAAKMADYVFYFVLTYTNDEEKRELEQMVQAMQVGG